MALFTILPSRNAAVSLQEMHFGTSNTFLPSSPLIHMTVDRTSTFLDGQNYNLWASGSNVRSATTPIGAGIPQFAVTGEWASLRQFAVNFGANDADVVIRNFVHVDLSSRSADASNVQVLDVKRANLETGSGDDLIDIRARTNSSVGAENLFVVTSGQGNDRVTLAGQASPIDGALAAVARIDLGFGDDTVALRTTARAEVLAGAGDDTIQMQSVGQASVQGQDGFDTLLLEGRAADWMASTLAGTITLSSRFGWVSMTGMEQIRFAGAESALCSRISAILADGASDAMTSILADRPVLAQADRFVATEDVPVRLGAGALLANDVAIDGGLAAIAGSFATDLGGRVDIAADGSFVYTAAGDFAGTDTFRYVATDADGDRSEAVVTLEVGSVDDPVTAAADRFATVEDQALVVDAARGLLANDRAPDGGIEAIAGTWRTEMGGSVTVAADGSFNFRPADDLSGTDRFTYTVRDQDGDLATATATIDVARVDDAAFGVYVGNTPALVDVFEQVLQGQVDQILVYGGKRSWSDFVSSVDWISNQFKNRPEDLMWSIPLTLQSGTTLEQAAAGEYNSYYRAVARELATTPGTDEIYVRTGWEFNGGWFPWAAQGKEDAFVGAFRQFVDTFRSVSDRFVFEWNVNEAHRGMDPARAYPGDAYVDVIGMDFYWNTAWHSHDPVTAWNNFVNLRYGLQWLEDFADAHDKPTAYSEWGVMTNNAAPYLQLMRDWIANHDVLYANYWDSNAAYPGRLSNNQNPDTTAAFARVFDDMMA